MGERQISVALSLLWLHLTLDHGDDADEATRKVEALATLALDVADGQTSPPLDLSEVSAFVAAAVAEHGESD